MPARHHYLGIIDTPTLQRGNLRLWLRNGSSIPGANRPYTRIPIQIKPARLTTRLPARKPYLQLRPSKKHECLDHCKRLKASKLDRVTDKHFLTPGSISPGGVIAIRLSAGPNQEFTAIPLKIIDLKSRHFSEVFLFCPKLSGQ